MANQWLRLWHDMPTDPKWRTISKASGQRIGDVMAVYLHLLVCASNATERGRTQSFNCEDVASALDLDLEQVDAIVKAMQSRVLEGDTVKGWEKRQVAREDGAAERAKAWREDQKALKTAAANAAERNRTHAERIQTPDKDKEEIREEKKEKGQEIKRRAFALPEDVSPAVFSDWQALRKAKKAPITATAIDGIRREAQKAGITLETALAMACERGWTGFKAEWLVDRSSGANGVNKQSSLEARNKAVADSFRGSV